MPLSHTFGLLTSIRAYWGPVACASLFMYTYTSLTKKFWLEAYPPDRNKASTPCLGLDLALCGQAIAKHRYDPESAGVVTLPAACGQVPASKRVVVAFKDTVTFSAVILPEI